MKNQIQVLNMYIGIIRFKLNNSWWLCLKKITKQYSVNYLVIGDGDIVISQSPEKGEKLKKEILLFCI